MKIDWCKFGFHEYTNWENKGIIEVYTDIYYVKGKQVPTKKFMLQERHCKNCNKLKSRREYI